MSDTSQKPEVDSKELTLSEALKEIKRLKKALDLEKMRSAGYSHMIELAEQQFSIPIRKKSGTKQQAGCVALGLASVWTRGCICQTLHQPFRSPVLCIGYLPTPIKPTGEVVHHLNVYRAKFRKTFCQTRLNTSQFLR